MKDFFNRRQRFSLRKYSIGVCSVLLGTALFAAHGAQADELASTDTPVTPEESVTGDDSSSLVTTSTTTAQQTDPTSVVSASTEPSATLDLTPSVTTSADASTGETTNTQAETAKESNESVSESSVENHSDKVSQTDSHENSSDKTQKSSNSDDSNRSSRTRRDTSAAASASSTVAVDAQKEVSSWSEFVAALQDSSIKEITVKGNIVAAGDNGNTDNGRSGSVDRKITINTQARPLTIKGENQNASLDLLSNTLELTGAAWELNFKNLKLASANSKGPVDLSKTSGPNTVTFDNVTSVGSSLYGGGGNTNVVIKGNTTSTVSDSYQSGNGQTQYVQRNVGQAGRSDKRRESNIHDAKAVIVSEGASLTLNRSSQGDAITLESGAKVSVQDRANLTINMNTDNATDTARYHNAGIFMADGGTVETGKESKLVLNTSIGQGISLGINRPGDGVTDKDRFGGYGTGNSNRKNGPSKVIIGDGATFELNGRDGVMAGNNAEFTTGATSKVRFENKGRGVAIDLGNNSKVNFGKNSTNTFHSVGKGPKSGGGPSGSYDGYNYIGLNENGRIVVDDYATFRVQMDDRGDNAWDDVISLGSENGQKDQPLFQANKGSIVDIRDDNTNYYAELISVALGNSSNTFFQFNNPLYVSLLRYTRSDGLSAGEVTGKLPASTPQGNNPEDIGHGNILYISNKSASSGNRVEFNGPTGTLVNPGLGTYTVYSLNKDGRDAQSRNKQSSVWTNIQGGALSIAGFQSNHADINPANAQSVPTGSSTGGISATDRTYGIDPVGDNRQNIWISNGSTINPTAIHKNVIKYVYEDGTPVKDDVIQSSDWNRTLEVAIDQDQFKDVLKNSTVSNGDEFLTAYSKAKYNVGDIDGDGKADTGWRVAGTTNDETVNYTAVTSPKLSGYKAEILSTNVPGLKAGDNADSVAASYTYNPSTAPADTIIETSAGRRTISDTYWRNIVAKSDLGSYETVVVYKKEKQKATIHYVDVSANNKELASDSVEGDSGANIDYSTANKIQEFVDKGYKLVEDGFTKATADEKKYDNDASVDQEFTVKLEHDKVPVGPNDPHNPTDPINPNDPNSPKYPATDQWKKDVTSTVHYVGAGSQTPNDNVQNAQWTRTLNLDKVTGKVLNPDAPWTANKANYDAVPTPNVTGYYADKASVPTKTVTQDNLEETVTYKPLGSLVPKPETPNDPNFPSTPGVKYPNDPTDPTKPGQPVVPDVPGYEPHLPDPNDPTKPGQPIQPGTPVTPDKPGEDTPIIYVPKTTEVTKPTKQTVTFEGAGDNTPAAKVQNDFTFTGKQKNGTTTWDQPNHTYGKETVPVVEHYYADKKEAGSKTVTPDQPEVTDKVTYKPLGKIIPVDETNTPIPSAPTPQYNNDPQDPTKGGETPTPVIPGYVTDTPSVTPNDPGSDTPVVYRKAEQKAVIKYVDQNTGTTLENDQVSGKSGEAIDYSTAAKIKKYQDRGYVLVSDEFPKDAHFDTDASVDQIWTVTLKHGETPVGPNDPHNPTDPINPNDPNSPKYPATDQWKKDVTSTVKYVVSDGKATAPADNVQNAQWTRTLNLDKVTGKVLNPDAPWTANKANYDAVPTPNVTGYYADKASVPTKTVTQDNLEETVTYKPLGSLVPKPVTPNDPNFPSTPGVKYPNDPTDPTKPGQPVVPDVPGYEPHLPDPNDPTKPGQPIQPGTPVTPDKPGEDTPIIYVPKTNDVTQPTKQTVKYTSTDGKAQVPSDKIQNDYTFTGKKNQADGTTTWTENSHTYGRESVPVVSGYYADKSEAGSKTVTPTNPNAEDVVTYKPLGKIIQVDEDGNVIPNSSSVTYNNNPSNPREAAETKIPDAPTGYVIKEEQPQAWGYNIVDKTIEPNDESDPDRISQDTKIVYVKADQKAVIKYVDQTTGQTLANDQVGGKSGEAINYSTADKIKYYEDRGYVLVSDEFPAGAHFDTDASVDQTWTVTLKHGETPVGPNDPHNPTDPINPNDPNSPKYPATDQWKKDVTSTVKYVVSDGKVAAPADHVEKATWTRTLTLDKVTGKELSATPWASDKTAYAAVPTPGLTGYYADKASVASKTVTQENLEETVTYKPLGNLVPKPVTPNDPNFPSTPDVKYPNDPTDPTKPGQPVVPDVPGYEPHLPDPKDPTKPGQPIQPGTPVTPDKPGEDTPIIYVPKTNDVTQPTKQTVTFEGAGSTTPKDDVQSDYTFTGKKNQADGTTTWTEKSHDYGKVKVPVVEHYYADKAEAGGKTVTPEHPEATDKVVYKELGKIIPVDPDGNPIPNAPTPQYTNDPNDPTKGGVTPTPVIPGYVTDIPNVTPSNPGTDTPVVYRKADQKAVIKYVDQTTGQTLANDQVGGKSGEAINYSTADKIKYYEDRGYVLVSDEFPAGAHFDNDASVDQTWTVTLKHGETPVGPNDPHNPTDPINPNDPNSPKYPATDQWKKDVTSTVKYVVSDGKATAPADHVEKATWTRTLTLDKVTGKELSATPWASDKTAYAAVPTPGLTGYYADKASVASKTVTQENLEETVTYKPLGNLVPKPVTPNDPNFPSTPDVKYPNDPTDPTKPGQPVVPDVPGYEPHLPDPKDPTKPGQPIQPGTPVTPDKPGEDTPIIYVPKTNDVTQPTKQTVTFEGAGSTTPKDDVQSDYTFTGKKNQADGTTTWTEKSHDYGKVKVPVVEHYYADKAEAGGKTVTPEHPEATDKVVYKELGKIIPVDPDGNPIPNAPTPQYTNDPNDPTKGGVTPTPVIPGYVTDIPNVTPSNPGTDTPVVYRKADQKAVIKYVDQTTGQTLANDQVGGKSGEAINYSTADKIKYYEDRGYVLVSDEFPAGAHFDTDASVDQTWTVTLKHGETPVGPNDPHNPTDPINPNDPNSPKYPATDQWKKDVTSTVKYVVSDGKATAPADHVEKATWTRTLTLDKVTGKELSATPWASDKTAYAAVPTPGLTGYYADKASVASKAVTQENLEETVTYKPLGNLVPKPVTPNDPHFPSTPEVKYPNDPTDPTKPGQPVVPDVPGYKPYLPDPKDPTKPGQPIQPGTPVTPDKPGEDTPIIYVPKTNDVTQPTKQTVTFEGAGSTTPKDDVQSDYTFTGKKNQADGTTTWTEKSHDYGKVKVPVVEHYYADKAEAGGKTVTPEHPEATDKVVYKELGKIIPVDPDGNPIPNAPTPQYTNDPNDPTKGGVTPTPVIPGYVTDIPNVTPSNPGTDTPVVYRKADQKAVIKYVDQTTGQTLANDQVGGKSGEAINYSTADKIKYYEDRGYVLVSDEFPAGAHFDNDASVDQTWTVTLKHGETPVGPNDPHNPTDPINPNDPNSPKYPATDQWKKDVTSTVKYVVSDGKATAPADHVEKATWTRTLTLDKVTGKELSATPWASDKTAYAAVPTPGLTGYYADKASVASKAVTQENLEETVTYKPLGNLVPKPVTPNDPHFPSTPEVKYPNDPTDPTKPGQPVVPDVPGYEPHLPDPKDPTKPGQPIQPGTPVTPDKPGEDTPIIYVPKTNDVTQPTKQTVTFEGAGSTTPKDDVQSDYTFTGKKNQADGTTTWTEKSHDYGKVKVPVVEHYYADKAEAGGKTVTPEHPEATDKVVYKELGKIIPVDPDGNPIPNAPTPQYTNDPNDPTKGGVTPTPVIPGYVTDIPNVTPSNPGTDTPVVYRKADQKAVIKYVDQTTGQTLANDQVGGKSGEAINYSTADKIKYYEDRGYVLVSDEFPAGAHFDTDASVDQTWTVTLKHGETPVGPNDPHNPTDPINPNDPNSPKYPATDQWKKDVTSTVKYVVSDGKATAPADHVEKATWTRTLTLDKVTGKELSATPWASDKTAYAAVPTPGLTGYYADKASVASKAVTQENLEETVTYKPLGNLVPKPVTPNDPHFPSTPEVKYPNDPTDPTKPGQPVVPDVPGYKPYLPDPNDPTKPGQPIQPGTPVTPDKPGEDTPIIYVPVTPDKPVTPPEQPKVPTPKKPEEPEQPVKPEQPVSPTVIEEVTPQVAQPQEQAVLPETGTESGHIAEVTGLSALITGLGLGLLDRRRKKED